MIESIVKMSSKHQIVIPSKIRKTLSIEAGDLLLCRIQDGEILLRPKPKSYSRYLRGLHKEVWSDVDVLQYTKQERKSWE
jgi:AbrB family looped-hinge helix DNA binding protein